jgi:adenine phosphoribosyltransferase
MHDRLRALIPSVPDFPKKGIMFRDITPLLADRGAWAEAIESLSAPFRFANITKVAGIESRGFMLGGGVARSLGAGFVPIRKPGKLPRKTHKETYALEYGTDALEIHQDAFTKEDRVLIVDDVLATGGTLGAAARLVKKTGATLAGAALLIEIEALGGRAKAAVEPLHATLRF